MDKNYEKIEINENYYRIQKLIDSQWIDKAKLNNQEQAQQKIDEFVLKDSKEFKKFQYRLIKVEEVVLYKSIETKPDDVTDIF